MKENIALNVYLAGNIHFAEAIYEINSTCKWFYCGMLLNPYTDAYRNEYFAESFSFSLHLNIYE